MMSIRTFLACLTMSVLCTSVALGQKAAEEADDAFKKGFYYNAIELYKKVTKGTHTYRLRIDSKLGWVYSDTFTQKRIAGWKSSITNTK